MSDWLQVGSGVFFFFAICLLEKMRRLGILPLISAGQNETALFVGQNGNAGYFPSNPRL